MAKPRFGIKASDLIKVLGVLIDEYGDLAVKTQGCDCVGWAGGPVFHGGGDLYLHGEYNDIEGREPPHFIVSRAPVRCSDR